MRVKQKAPETGFIKRILRTPWTERVSNEEILRKVIKQLNAHTQKERAEITCTRNEEEVYIYCTKIQFFAHGRKGKWVGRLRLF